MGKISQECHNKNAASREAAVPDKSVTRRGTKNRRPLQKVKAKEFPRFALRSPQRLPAPRRLVSAPRGGAEAHFFSASFPLLSKSGDHKSSGRRGGENPKVPSAGGLSRGNVHFTKKRSRRSGSVLC